MNKILFFIILNFNLYVFSQVQYDISYGNALNLGEIHENSTVEIQFNNKIVFKGNTINNYVFEIPGDYYVKVNEFLDHKIDVCSHKHLPENFIVNVAPYRINFIPTSLNISDNLIKNKDTNGIKAYVDIQVETYDKSNLVMNTDIVKTAGIGTNIKAKLDDKFKNLKNGLHTVSFNLEGFSSQASYIMFDFLEPNGNIQSLALTNPIKNE